MCASPSVDVQLPSSATVAEVEVESSRMHVFNNAFSAYLAMLSLELQSLPSWQVAGYYLCHFSSWLLILQLLSLVGPWQMSATIINKKSLIEPIQEAT